MEKKFAVIGLGIFGRSLASTLAEMGGEVLVIDIDAERVEQMKDKVTHAVIMDATQPAALAEQGLEQMDTVVVAMGKHFDLVVLIVTLLKQMGVKRLVARAMLPLHRKILKLLGVDEVVSPSEEMGERLGKILMIHGSLNRLELGQGYSIVSAETPSAFVGMKIKDMRLREEFRLNLVTILKPSHEGREDLRPVGVPSPETRIHARDVLVLFGQDDDIRRFMDS